MAAGRDYLKEIKDYNIRQASPVKKKAALLVIDMQHKFSEIAEPILSNVISLIQVCGETGIRILFTRHGNPAPEKKGGMLRNWWGDIIECGSADWGLLDALKPNQFGEIIDKSRYDAFFGTDLDEQLRHSNVTDIVICGVMTNCCCETTAREAFVRDYRVFFVADATATINDELHVASLKNLAYGFAYIVNTKDICRSLLKKK